ncbi:HAD-IA family hydrolase [Flavobacteriaceae bacterium R38]|nr:HAD-IA family hydrolase [Flavobacteriaceae bacterium R38]
MQPAIIFDMDGVLVDSEPFHKYIWNKVFDYQGIPFTNEYYDTLIGTSGVYSWNKIIKDFELKKDIDELMSFHKGLFYQELEKNDIPAVKGVVETLSILKEHQFSLSLGSSSPKKLINIIVDRLDIKSYFDFLVSSEDVENGKPAPDIFLEIANNYKRPSENFIVIEDSKNGIKAAKSAGMKGIGYRNVNSGNQDLSQADLIIESFEELTVQIIKEL